MSEALLHIKRAKSWRHHGLIYPSAEIYLADGIHLNEGENRALYKSYRGAILFALSQSRKYLSLHLYILIYIFLGELLVPPHFVISYGFFARDACGLKATLSVCTAILIYCNATRGVWITVTVKCYLQQFIVFFCFGCVWINNNTLRVCIAIT